ncbi:MAG TPA: substrate-binding domain-containing protein, partial [Nitrospiraceae bacterium]|nr:substrate-binding domain-containing protein [Nitrospiraceae bacterium]
HITPHMFIRVATILSLMLATTTVPAAVPGITGSMIIAGNGPELHTLEQLGRAFEKSHLGTVVEIRWDASSHPVDRVRAGEADFAVTGQADPTLVNIPIAWDGIAVVVYVANPTRVVTMQQVAAIFSGKVTRWAALGGQETTIKLIDRPPNQNIRHSFEETLGIVGQIPASAQVIRSDQNALSMVAGSLSAVAYASLHPALEAVQYGVDVTLLTIDQVEAAEETVRDGRYKLRRPVLLVSKKESNAVAEAFAAFVLSKEGQAIVGERFTPYSSTGR